jgi:L-asparaginase II
VHCAALPELGLGIAVKMDDGNNGRASEVALAAMLRALLPLADTDATFLDALTDAPLLNWRGVEVGRLRRTTPLPGPR